MADDPRADADGSPAKEQPSQPPVLQIVRSNASNLPRNLPVKRYDGDPLGRVEVQHALLCHLFSDTRRVFTNPRPGDRSTALTSGAGSAGVPAPVYPFGMSAGCVRRSGETEEEYNQWQEKRQRYLLWKRRLDRKRKLERKAAAAAAAETAGDNVNDDADANNEEKDELADAGNEEDAAEPKADEGDDDEDLGDPNEPLDEDEFPQPGAAKLTFKELYIESLLNSSKCTKSMRDKAKTTNFAVIYGQGDASEAFKQNLQKGVLFPQRLGFQDELASMVVECITNSYMNAETIRVDGGIRMQPK